MVERCARAYKKKHGNAPGGNSGTECLPGEWTWRAIDQVLRGGSRRLASKWHGLLSFLIAKGIAKTKKKCSKRMAMQCARAYKKKYGRRPRRISGTKCLPDGWTWRQIDYRENGLPGFLTRGGLK